MGKQRFNFTAALENNNVMSTNSSETANQISLDGERPKGLLDAFRIIPRNKIRKNSKNNYPISEIEKLKKYLLQYGIVQDIAVIYSMEEDIYIIESGHRRTTALDELISEYKTWDGDPNDPNYLLYKKNISCYENGYVCKVIDKLKENIDYDLEDELIDSSVIDSEIRLILSNEGAREITPVVRAKNINRLNRLYEMKNENKSKKDRININETISADMNMSLAQVKRYKSTEKLIPELKELFENEKIQLNEAVNYASLDEDKQYSIYKTYLSPIQADEAVSTVELKDQMQINKRNEIIGCAKQNRSNDKITKSMIIKSLNNLNKQINIYLSESPEEANWIREQMEQIKKYIAF